MTCFENSTGTIYRDYRHQNPPSQTTSRSEPDDTIIQNTKVIGDRHSAQVIMYHVHTHTKVPAEHYSIIFSVPVPFKPHCVISTLHLTASKVPAVHLSKLHTLYFVQKSKATLR